MSIVSSELELLAAPKFTCPNQLVSYTVKIRKLTDQIWNDDLSQPIYLSYHWKNHAGEMLVWDGLRTAIPQLKDNEWNYLSMLVQIPAEEGEYQLEINLVQDGVAWATPEQCQSLLITQVVENFVLSPAGLRRWQRIDSLRKISKNYRSWSEYLCWATINRTFFAPYTEQDQKILLYFSGYQEYLQSLYRNLDQQDLISIIMPVYNSQAVVSIAIDSILKQSYENWELLVVDDGSSDQTLNIISSYQDSRIKVIHQEHAGQSIARNLAMQQARGDYFAYLDSDNSWEHCYLYLMLNTLKQNAVAKSIYCAQLCQETYGPTNIEYLRFGPFHRALLENSNYIDINCYLHHRSLYEQFGDFKKELQTCEDWDLVLRYTESDFPIALPAILSNYYYNSIGQHVSHQINQDLHQKIDRNLRGSNFIEANFVAAERFYPLSKISKFQLERPVTIIIPSYEAPEALKLCLAALIRETSHLLVEIIIVDNASGEAVREILSDYELRNNVQVIRNSQNLGFTAAVNQGIAIAQADSDLVLLNNDAIVTAGWLEALQEVVCTKLNIGIVVPRQVLPAETETLDVHSPYASFYREADVNLSHHHQNIINPEYCTTKGYQELSFAPFFCVYLNRACVEKLGMLNARDGRHYYSDNIYCDLARHHGNFKIIYTPHSKVYHLLQQSTKELASKPEDYQSIFLENAWKGFEQLPAEINTELQPQAAIKKEPKSFKSPTNLFQLTNEQQHLVTEYTKMYYNLWQDNSEYGRQTVNSWWLGHLAQKCPLDLWMYQEIIVETRPDLIIECGTNQAGSTLFLATICDLLGIGKIVSVDIHAQPDRPDHQRIEYLLGSSTDPTIVEKVRRMAANAKRVMVILDSDHSCDHVWRELTAYAALVSEGCYLIVEDTAINGHPYAEDFGPGPMEAMHLFLETNKNFTIDVNRERFLTTLNPSGYLKRLPIVQDFTVTQTGSTPVEDLSALVDQLLNFNQLEAEQQTKYPVREPKSLADRRELRELGLDWPESAVTMIGKKRLLQFKAAVEEVIAQRIPGDIVETGVWRGGACILARAILKNYQITDRSVWLVDSFEGLPSPRAELYPEDQDDQHYLQTALQVSVDQVKANFNYYRLLDHQVKFLPGWFANTLPNSPITEIAVLRLDGDLYESTIQALENLYPKLMPGGIVIIDDYWVVPACQKAVEDYLAAKDLKVEKIQIDGTGIYWKKPEVFSSSELMILHNASAAQPEDADFDFWEGDSSAFSEHLDRARELFGRNENVAAKTVIEEILAVDVNFVPAYIMLARQQFQDTDYLTVLQTLHQQLNPRVYLEIGVFRGESLKLAKDCRRIGIDPRPVLAADWSLSCELYRMQSSEFFASGHAEFAIGETSFDLAFVDGAHHFEQALLDFMALEQYAHRNSCIILHDTLPVHSIVAERTRRTTFYTGDIWRLVLLLQEQRPDLKIKTYDCYPSGLTVITNLDFTNRTLWNNYQELTAYYREIILDSTKLFK